ncbi:hypothetical protein [Halalkalibacter lacteus]|uniref:hypothetical protein n=1 Tax=Halalkalibacter lacteus TaxID=3090663 RepID=UPI002FC81C8A
MIEVLSALTFLMLFSASIFPILTIVYEERLAIREEEKVLYELEETIHHYISTSTIKMSSDEAIVINSEVVDNEFVRICAEWVAINGRMYERCLLASK